MFVTGNGVALIPAGDKRFYKKKVKITALSFSFTFVFRLQRAKQNETIQTIEIFYADKKGR